MGIKFERLNRLTKEDVKRIQSTVTKYSEVVLYPEDSQDLKDAGLIIEYYSHFITRSNKR